MSDLPKTLMKDVYWAFRGGIYESQELFNEEVRDYQIHIAEEDIWKTDEEIFSQSSIQICYEYWTDDEEELEEIIELKADNGKSFTTGELFFKLHNAVVKNLKNGDHIFFEGLNLSEETYNDKPFYWMYLGS